MIEGRFGFTLGRERQLLVDELLIQQTNHLQPTLHQPEKHPANPVLRPDHPGEKHQAHGYGTILFDPEDDLFKAWYLTGGRQIAYATSVDGLEWDKPARPDPLPGGATPNTVYSGIEGQGWPPGMWTIDNFSVMIDTETPGPRYKALAYPKVTGQINDTTRRARELHPKGLYTAQSDDGLHWTTRPDPVLSHREDSRIDDACSCMWDPLRNRFIAFTKQNRPRPMAFGDTGAFSRARGVSFSDDFAQWTRPVPGLGADDQDPRDVQLYRQTGWTDGGMYLGLLEIYYSDIGNKEMAFKKNFQLVTSRDGESWWRAGNRQTFLPTGGKGDWDCYMLHANTAPPVLRDGRLWFFYGGSDFPHERDPEFFPWPQPWRTQIGVATLRQDGYRSYDAGSTPGRLVTRPIRFKEGTKLCVNAAIRGELRVTAHSVKETERGRQDAKRGFIYHLGDPLPGYGMEDAVTATGDSTRMEIKWKERDLLPQNEEWISLQFHLCDAALYSFWAE